MGTFFSTDLHESRGSRFLSKKSGNVADTQQNHMPVYHLQDDRSKLHTSHTPFKSSWVRHDGQMDGHVDEQNL